nr:class I tRNA ligase family protein [Haloglomus sp. DT116]
MTCGLPYANGDLHIGHLRIYVGSDVFSCALEKLGQQTVPQTIGSPIRYLRSLPVPAVRTPKAEKVE